MSPLTQCHVISQSAFTRRESNFGGNVQMALPKNIFKCFFFCDDMELPYLYLRATNNKEFTGKSSLISRNEKCCESEDHSE